ncbi:hypothetical protein ABT093_35980 [Kitasatospora sp. NPDC002551]|uniref:hypothetical protein n=1 Tax=Kitasatospora sp. NPDC002551 TaxID=3154539 RepID=UPI00331ED7E6
MAFPGTPLGVQVELQVGGTWTDVTADAYLRDPISIERGRGDEGSRIDPGKCPISLDNRSGKYSPRNAAGPYHGLIGRNTPVRVTVADPALPTYLDLPGPGSYASTPDTAALDLTADLDVRIDLTLPATQTGIVEIAAKYSVAGGQRSWQLTLQDDVPTLRWSVDGTAVIDRTATLPLPLPASGRLALRAALDADNGSGAHTVTFWTAPTIAGPWAQLGDVVTATGTTSIYASTAPLTVGDNPGQTVVPPVGHIHAFQLRGAGGALVAAPDFTALAPGTTNWTDAAGRAWTLAGGATIPPRRSVRFTGEASAWSPRRDTSGRDRWVPIEAAGIKRRLGQGKDPLASTLRRSLSAASPVAYWPMEDARGSSQAFSPIPGCPPLVATGLEFAAGDGPTGSLPLPRVSHGATISAPVPNSTALAAGWRVEMVYNLPELPAAAAFPPVLRIASTGTAVQWFVAIDEAFVTVFALDANGGIVTNTGTAPAGHASGGWARLQLDVWDDGTGTAWELRFFLIGSNALGSVWNTHAGPPGVPLAVDTLFDEALGDMQLGHLSVMPTGAGDAYGHADNGYEGDRPVQRLGRLCAEESVPLTSIGLVDPQIALGPQQAAPLLDLLEEAGEVDGGYLTESRTAAALHYRPAYLSYNQQPTLVLDYATGDVAPPLEPVDDDQSTRNDVTVTRRGGSSARAVAEEGPLSVQAPPAGIGRYPDDPELNLYQDTQLDDVAGWRLHLGTWDAARYRRVRVDLAACPHLIAAASAVEVGDLIRIINLPPEDGPTTVDLIAQGSTETLSAYDWAIEFNTTPAGPWSVAVTDDLVLASADTAASTLAAGATATATTLSIATTSGPLWSTAPADYPLDLDIAGERVTVTAMAGATSPQTATVTRSVNSVVKAQLAGATVRLWQPAITAL